MHTRRGRAGEWASCFTTFCLAVGARARWVWNSEDHVWTEVYSSAQNRWVHVDATEGAWDQPGLYAEKWGKKIAYCIAFSKDGATDVTRRYVRNGDQALKRDKCSEEDLSSIIRTIRKLRRSQVSEEKVHEIEAEDIREENELGLYITSETLAKFMSTHPLTYQSSNKSLSASAEDKAKEFQTPRQGDPSLIRRRPSNKMFSDSFEGNIGRSQDSR